MPSVKLKYDHWFVIYMFIYIIHLDSLFRPSRICASSSRLAFLDPFAHTLHPLCGLIVVSVFYAGTRSLVFNGPPAPFPKRTHSCGALTAADVGSRVVLTGWLLPER
jgi:hypothetical protein